MRRAFQAKGQLDRIRESFVQSAERVTEINHVARQQMSGATSVVKAMESVQRIAQQAQAGTMQTRRATESLVALSSELLVKLGKFKIGNPGALSVAKGPGVRLVT